MRNSKHGIFHVPSVASSCSGSHSVFPITVCVTPRPVPPSTVSSFLVVCLISTQFSKMSVKPNEDSSHPAPLARQRAGSNPDRNSSVSAHTPCWSGVLGFIADTQLQLKEIDNTKLLLCVIHLMLTYIITGWLRIYHTALL